MSCFQILVFDKPQVKVSRINTIELIEEVVKELRGTRSELLY